MTEENQFVSMRYRSVSETNYCHIEVLYLDVWIYLETVDTKYKTGISK